MRTVAYASIGTYLVVVTAMAAEPQPFTGHFEGTGRAYYGTLAIKAKTIAWKTAFSQCRTTPFELIEQDRQDGRIRLTYQLKTIAPSCRFSILTLTHTGPSPQSGWEATGYGSRQSCETDKSSGYKAKPEDMMSCSVIRAPDK